MDASRVSAILTIAPIFSLLLVEICAAFWPERVQTESLYRLSYFDTLLVVCGCMATALGSKRTKR